MAMIVYLIEGASGLPFFYGGSGGIGHLGTNGRLPYCLSGRSLYPPALLPSTRLGSAVSDSGSGNGPSGSL